LKIYGISGLAADEKMFAKLSFHPPNELAILPWEPSSRDQTLQEYASKFVKRIDQSQPVVLLGLSFGGMLISEICDRIPVTKAILISSAPSNQFIPKWLKIVPNFLITPGLLRTAYRLTPWFVFDYFFGSRNEEGKKLIRHYLKNMNFRNVSNHVRMISNWSRKETPSSVVRIHAMDDRLLSFEKSGTQYVLERGGHFAILSESERISEIINHELRQLNGLN